MIEVSFNIFASLDDKQAIVDAIIQMAHRLKIKVVAEGVESVQQVELSEKMGCDYMYKGIIIVNRLPMDELIDFLQCLGNRASRKD